MSERERRQRIIEHLQQGNTREAADEMAGRREQYPGDGLLHHAIGLAFASQGTLTPAREQLEAAVELAPDSADIVADLAQVCLAQGEVERAIERAERALELAPGSAVAHFTLGRACLAEDCAAQSRNPPRGQTDFDFPLIDGKTERYLRALREMEAALDAAPHFVAAVRGALAFAYLRAGHYHAALEQLEAQLQELPSGEEADRVADRLQSVRYEIARETYWALKTTELETLEQAASSANASPELKLRLAHVYAALGKHDELAQALAEARAADYQPRAAAVARSDGPESLVNELSDVHLLIAGGLECVVEDALRFLPFSELASVSFGPPAPWRPAEIETVGGDQLQAVVPSLYRLSLRSPNDLIQSGRFTQFRYSPGETRYALALGTRNFTSEEGIIPFTELTAIRFV